VYPRLAKLEDEGLVERTEDGRKATYAITDAGRREVAARQLDLADLQQDLDHSVRELAQEVRLRVHGSATDLRAELKEAAKQARASATPAGTSYEKQWPNASGWDGSGTRNTTARDIESAINAFRFEVRDAVRRVADDSSRQEILDILSDAAQRIREVLRRP
jgi:DNA-binding MarR family transcriptional regulator